MVILQQGRHGTVDSRGSVARIMRYCVLQSNGDGRTKTGFRYYERQPKRCPYNSAMHVLGLWKNNHFDNSAIPCLLMHWRLHEPVHRQAWYCHFLFPVYTKSCSTCVYIQYVQQHRMSCLTPWKPGLCLLSKHYNDVIMGAMASHINAPRHGPLWGELTGHQWILRTKGQWRGKSVHLVTSSWNRRDFDWL